MRPAVAPFVLNAPQRATPFAALRLSALVLWAVWVGFASTTQHVSNDFWLQVRIGELISQQHAIPQTLLFPFTEIATARFNAHEWLPSLAASWFVKHLGEAFLPVLSGMLGLALFFLVLRLAFQRSGQHIACALGLAALALVVENFRHELRPELLALFALQVCLWCLHSLPTHPRWAAVVYLLTTALWSNTHGSFVLAPALLICCGVGAWLDAQNSHGAPWQPYAFLAPLAGLATLVTPFGLEQWQFVLGFSSQSQAKLLLGEWRPTWDISLHVLRGWWIGLAALALTWAVVLRHWQRVPWRDLMVWLLFTVLALKAVRFLAYAGLGAAFVLAPLARKEGSVQIAREAKQLAIVLLFALMAWALVLRFGNAFGAYPTSLAGPPRLSKPMVQLVQHPTLQGPVLNSYSLGAELIYRGYPRMRPSIDSRIDSYGDAYFFAHEALWTAPQRLEAFVQRYGVRYALLDPDDWATVQQYHSLDPARWRMLLMDSRAVMLERKP